MDYLSFCESVLGPGNKTSSDEYEFDCPNGCGPKLGVNVNKGIYRCFICGSKDSIPWRDKYQLSRNGKFFGCGPIQLLAAYFNKEDILSGKAAFDGLPVTRVIVEDKPLPIARFRLFLTSLFQNPEVTEGHTEFLHKRGFTEAYWAERGIKVSWGDNPLNALSSSIALTRMKELCTREDLDEFQLLNDNGTTAAWLKDKILIPYFNLDSSFVLGARGRTTLEVAKLKYVGPRGLPTGRLTYNLPDLLGTDVVLLSEGELKTKLPSLFGAKAVSLPGVTTGKETALENFIRFGIKKLVVCFDTESLDSLEGDKLKSKQQAKEAVENTWLFFKEYGPQNGIETVHLELPDEGHKVDIDSFIMEHGPSVFFDLLEDIGVSFERKWEVMDEVKQCPG